MEKLQILPEIRRRRIHRCGMEVLRIFAPTVTGTTPAAAHAAALIAALVTNAESKTANEAEAALCAAIAAKALLHFTRHEIKITVTAEKKESGLFLSFSYLHKSGDTVYENSTLHTYWSADEHLQYAHAPRHKRRSLTAQGQKRIALFSRATLRTRTKCDKI